MNMRKKEMANLEALVLLVAINNPTNDPITVGQIKKHLMEAPFNMSPEGADKTIREVKGLKLKGEGDDAVISRISLPVFTSVKKVLPFKFQLESIIPEEIIKKIGEEKALTRKIPLLVGLMDYMGIYAHQVQLTDLLKDAFGVKKRGQRVHPVNATISHLVRGGLITKPFEKKGVNMILAPGDEEIEGLGEITELYDSILIESIKRSQPKQKRELPDFRLRLDSDVEVRAKIDGNHITADIVASSDVVEEVIERFKAFLADLTRI